MIFKAQNLQSLYHHIETNTPEYYGCFQQFQFGRLATTFQHFASENPTKTAEAEQAKWEELFFDLSILHDDFFNLSMVPPQLKIKPPQQELLRERIEQAAHPLLISRYAHILHLLINTKDEKEKYGRIALEAYLDFLKILDQFVETKDKKEEKEDNDYYLKELYSHLIINAFLLSIKLSYQIETTKKELLNILRQEKCIEWIVVLDLALKNQEHFDKFDFIGFQKKAFQIGYHIMEPRDFQYSGVAIEYFEAGKTLAIIAKNTLYPWDEIIKEARAYLSDILAHYDHIYDLINKESKGK